MKVTVVKSGGGPPLGFALPSPDSNEGCPTLCGFQMVGFHTAEPLGILTLLFVGKSTVGHKILPGQASATPSFENRKGRRSLS